MIVAGLLLVLIGSADIARAALAPHSSRAAALGVFAVVGAGWALVSVLAATGLGVPVAWLGLLLVLAVGWLVTTARDAGARPPGSPAVTPSRHPRLRILPAVVVILVIGASFFWNPVGGGLHGYLVDGLAQAPVRPLAALPVETVMLAVGLALFLVESANIVVRAALRPAIEPQDAMVDIVAAGDGDGRVEVETTGLLGSRTRVVVRDGAASADPPAVQDLRGGRLIGPLERLLIVALSLAGALPIVAGLLAAKGIVRFPEISNDRARGSKAEYFLVGSLVSWALALLAAGTLWISAQH
ncbi:hypothetical protein [Herbiconiux liangxiaofengii]|uniref:hypothetical protein n=1 Tax=Herbiconiux liangxiaofengii TaxID=3342795 RepID=UPI0035B9671E